MPPHDAYSATGQSRVQRAQASKGHRRRGMRRRPAVADNREERLRTSGYLAWEIRHHLETQRRAPERAPTELRQVKRPQSIPATRLLSVLQAFPSSRYAVRTSDSSSADHRRHSAHVASRSRAGDRRTGPDTRREAVLLSLTGRGRAKPRAGGRVGRRDGASRSSRAALRASKDRSSSVSSASMAWASQPALRPRSASSAARPASDSSTSDLRPSVSSTAAPTPTTRWTSRSS